MDVTFGLWADGGASPDHGGLAGGAIGRPVVGPAGFVEILETALGMGGPHAAHVVRIAAFQSALESLEGEHFWSASLATDPWSTARSLLGWRDELVGLGWRDDASWSAPRMRQLAAASQAATTLAPGLGDRVAAILQELAGRANAPIASIRLIDPLDLHPAPFRRLLSRLADIGATISIIAPSAASSSASSLGRLQQWLLGASVDLGDADGTVTVATCASEPLAAELIAQWFAGQTEPGTVLVAQDGDTAILDQSFAAFGQPRAGRSRPSVHRGSLQLLLLAFKASWAPFDAHALMQILVFPGSPISPRAAWHLASALEAAPGRGGPEWEDAWTNIAAAEQERSASAGEPSSKSEARISRWREWAEPTLSDPSSGMPIEVALRICDRTAAWAAQRYASTDDVLYAATAKLAGEVRAALVSLGRELLPMLLIERVIDQALDLGQANPSARAEAASWRSVPHPGAVWAPTRALVWWGFGVTSEGTQRSPWTEREREELAAAGCPADDVTLPARAASAAWERAILNAREGVLLVAAGLDCEAEDSLHPLAHRLKPALDRLGARIGLETALRAGTIDLVGSAITREAIVPRQLPSERFAWKTPEGFADRLEGSAESASSLESLLSCQLMWALRHVARVRPGRVRSIPDANQLLGNLAHAIAREIFVPGAPPEPAAAARMAGELLEDAIDQLAAPLRHPEHAEELNHARRRLPDAIASLARCLAENGLTVEATELQVSGEFETLLAMRGAVDLVARDSAGNAVIIDLKWTYSDKARADELKNGNAVQLATYGALVAGDQAYRAGYFLLNQRQFVTLTGSGLIGRTVDGARGFPDTWTAIVGAWKIWRETAQAGQILATGVEGVADLLPAEIAITREVRCDCCDYATLCRKGME